MIRNTGPRVEPLSEEALATLERGWDRLGSEVGVRFDHPKALELFRSAGQTVDGDVVRFDPGFLQATAGLAPENFELKARNPDRSLRIGGDSMIFAATNGPPFVRDGEERREGTMADAERFLMLTQASGVLDTPGRNIVEPNNVPLDIRHLVRTLAAIRLTDMPWAAEASSTVAAEDCLEMAAIVHGGRASLDSGPVLFANVNVNSPLQFDSRMLEGLLAHASAGQAVIVTPFLLMGAMAPVTIAAALVQQTVEALAGIALVQLVRPGCASVMGSFLSATDMQSGSPSFGGPESTLGLYASGQIARQLHLPWRSGGGGLTASQTVDFQSGYEAFNTMSAAFYAGANVCWQSAGWLEGGLVTCYEKFVADCELVDLLSSQSGTVEVDEETLAFDAHVEVGQGGHFFGAQHTLERFRDCFWRPTIGSTENIDRWVKGGSADYARRAQRRWREQLDEYVRPPLDSAIEAELIQFVERRALELGDPMEVSHEVPSV